MPEKIDIMQQVRLFESEVWLKEPSLKNKVLRSSAADMVFEGIDNISVSVRKGLVTIKFQFEASVLELCTPITPDAMGVMVRNCTDQDIKSFVDWAIHHKEEILRNIRPNPES